MVAVEYSIGEKLTVIANLSPPGTIPINYYTKIIIIPQIL